MWLKPIPERPPQHAGVRPLRSTLEDKMFAVKKISRVTAIEREWLKARERTESCGSPFPAVAEKIVNAECARARGMRVHGSGMPSPVVEIAADLVRLGIAPRIHSIYAMRSAVGGAMPLRFSGKSLAAPASERRGFGVTNINGPRKRQRNCPEHRTIFPLRVLSHRLNARHPKMRVLEALLAFPFPIFGPPVARSSVPTGSDKFQVFIVCHRKDVNREARHVDLRLIEFVIPSEFAGLSG